MVYNKMSQYNIMHIFKNFMLLYKLCNCNVYVMCDHYNYAIPKKMLVPLQTLYRVKNNIVVSITLCQKSMRFAHVLLFL